ESVRIEELVSYGSERLPAGPNVSSSDAILVVEGRNDVANLLKNGIKNAIATQGTSIPDTIKQLSKEKVVTAFVDGDRGGELLLKELLQVGDVDFVARAPRAREVEELTQKQLMKSLRNKLPVEQYIEEVGFKPDEDDTDRSSSKSSGRSKSKSDRSKSDRSKSDRSKGGRSRGGRSRGGRSKSQEKGQDKGRRERSQKSRRREQSQKDDKGRGRREEKKAEPPKSQASGELAAFKTQLSDLSGKLQGVLLDDKGKVVKGPMAVRDLADTLKREGSNVQSVVFDGVITQRLVDIAQDKGIHTLVGMKKGNITNEPRDVEVLTRDDI
ncbi:MAG: toprim domain-containing protein, partial [Candidatus Thermoplasmatota archaeon]|nr:toprim domain-containing protein [Candidatus Thermoplasmatota archaeon]